MLQSCGQQMKPKVNPLSPGLIPMPNSDDHQRYEVIERFPVANSQVYRCRDVQEGHEVVIKAETIGKPNPTRLEKEWLFYQRLAPIRGFDIALRLLIGLNHRFLVMKMLGVDLRRHVLREVDVGMWTIEDVKGCAVQMIAQLEAVHSKGIVHLDPKPNNFVTLAGKPLRVQLIDFDVSKEYLTVTGAHIPFREGLIGEIKGNRSYLSIHGHNGVEQSRRDDLLFLGYSLVWMTRKTQKLSLPWDHDIYAAKDHLARPAYHQWIRDLKEATPLEELCLGYKCLIRYMEACYGLEFEAKPDYQFLKSLFRNYDINANEI